MELVHILILTVQLTAQPWIKSLIFKNKINKKQH